MTQEELKELVDKYPNSYELGEEVKKIYYRNKSKENTNTGMLWVGFLFLIIFSVLITWIVVA
ncbi:hypothetical protein UFOVP117_136 [uncultured Caudovirales phage]|uniref:Uncharacterized protein n=1 Tax=uncultured Caudovirales phage TaxID=2100421 RepID=A0A6J5L8U8_9CAUD|nr:hypothetical protein UFOVP117_136 [uncultured Caudovirales phage]